MAPTRFYGPALLPTSAATLFTAGAGYQSVIQLLHVMNQSASPATMTLSIGSDAAGTRIYDTYSFRGKEMRAEKVYYVLTAGENLQGFSGTASAILLVVSGKTVSVTAGWGSLWGLNWGG